MGITNTDIFGCLQPDDQSRVVEEAKDEALKVLYSNNPELCPHNYILTKPRQLTDVIIGRPFMIKCKWCNSLKKIKKGDPEWNNIKFKP